MTFFTTYFFIPANNKRFIEKSIELEYIDCRVFDLEDSIVSNDVKNAINNLKEVNIIESDWVRFPILDGDKEDLKDLINIGLYNLVLPKLKSKNEFISAIQLIKSVSEKFKIIILVENPEFLSELYSVLTEYHNLIYGIGFGSHDFCAESEMSHIPEIIDPIRLQLSILAKAFNIEPIDIASMHISEIDIFSEEVTSGFNMGYRSKFILHPSQLENISNHQFYSEKEVRDAEIILEEYSKLEASEAVLSFDGKIYEKPHLNKLKTIVSWGAMYYGANR